MLNAEAAGSGPGTSESVDGAACLLEGLYAYLEEIEGYRAVCQRHEGAATVDEYAGELRVARRFEGKEETVAYLTSSVHVLPRRERQGRRRVRAGRLTARSLFRCEVIWGHRLLEVHVHEPAPGGILQVDLHVPRCPGALPELPLRTVADALRCHEFLVPEGIARPLPAPPGEGPDGRGIRAYLQRAMPPNLCASQCI